MFWNEETKDLLEVLPVALEIKTEAELSTFLSKIEEKGPETPLAMKLLCSYYLPEEKAEEIRSLAQSRNIELTVNRLVKFPPIEITGNSLQDIINLINKKNIVILYTSERNRVFHTISFDQPDGKESLENIQVIYVNCNSSPGLLEDGEWEESIRADIPDVKELSYESKLGEKLRAQKGVPNKVYVKI